MAEIADNLTAAQHVVTLTRTIAPIKGASGDTVPTTGAGPTLAVYVT